MEEIPLCATSNSGKDVQRFWYQFSGLKCKASSHEETFWDDAFYEMLIL
jgi:hypothetical protein